MPSSRNPKPLILVTNDDGVHAPGIAVLAEGLEELGEVLVAAPDTERSGASHSITLHSHLRATPVKDGWWAINGTPVDCVYLAALHLCDRPPDLVVSGVNAGFNLGTDVFYSGTVGGAAEGFFRGSSGLAISADRELNPRVAVPPSVALARRVLTAPERVLLNVNIPGLVPDPGTTVPIEVTRLGHRPYDDRVEQREDLHGRPYYWIGGPPADNQPSPGDDTYCVAHGRISVTPLELDVTASDLEPTRRLLAGPPPKDA